MERFFYIYGTDRQTDRQTVTVLLYVCIINHWGEQDADTVALRLSSADNPSNWKLTE